MVEKPKYKVLKKDGLFELREYEPYITAEVKVEAVDELSAMSDGFRLLADYIFGNNISMTAPVSAESEKIAMTAPVMASGRKSLIVSFVMPSKHTLKTLPKPVNKRVKLKQHSKCKFAVIKFKGRFSQDNFDERKKELKEWVKQEKLKPIGEYVYAGYNPPLIPGILRRNEVMVRVKS